MSTFDGFSEEDIEKLKTSQNLSSEKLSQPLNVKRVAQIGSKLRKPPQYKLQNNSNEKTNSIDINLEKCKLSIVTPKEDSDNLKQMTVDKTNVEEQYKTIVSENITTTKEKITPDTNKTNENPIDECSNELASSTKSDVDDKNYGEFAEKVQSAKLDELQLKQKLMEEQNRKRKEMLAKALADRAKQTEEEVLKLEKIKKELAVLDGQFSQDVGVLRKKIDQASLTYAEAEKQYLRVEKEFLQAKLNLQKEKEKKELLSEHLCALIMHNETRKAQKLVKLMEQLAHFGESSNSDNVAGNSGEENDSSSVNNDNAAKNDKSKGKDDKSKIKNDKNVGKKSKSAEKRGSLADKNGNTLEDSIEPIVVDGVDERTGKMIEVDLS